MSIYLLALKIDIDNQFHSEGFEPQTSKFCSLLSSRVVLAYVIYIMYLELK